MIGLSLLGPEGRFFVELILAFAAAVGSILVRRGSRSFLQPGLTMCAIGLLCDAVSGPQLSLPMEWKYLASAIGLVLLSWGIIKLLLDSAAEVAHRRRTHFSTIFKDLLTIVLYTIIVMAVLRMDFRVDPTSLLASTAVVAVVVGLALQELLGNIFSGLTLQLGKPFSPGDWVQSGNYVGRVQGIGWRSTAVVTRRNEKLEIPNLTIAKDVLINYSNGIVASELSIGLSYEAPPNYVREVIERTLRDVPGIMQVPQPEIVTWEYGDSSITYHIKYWFRDYADSERLRDAVNRSLWYSLKRNSIEIPFPIRTLKLSRQSPNTAADEAFEREVIGDMRQVDFLRNLDDEELRILLPGVTVKKFGAGEVIVREGDNGDALYMIRSGTVEVVAAGRDGKAVHIADLKHPAFFGEMALMTGEPRTATVRARTDAELIEVSRDGFVELFKKHPEAVAQIGEVIALRMTERRELINAAVGDVAREQTNWLLSKMRMVFNLASSYGSVR